MTFTLLTIGALVALTSLCAVATKAAETVNPVMAEDTTLVGLTDPAAETLSGDTKTPAPQREWHFTTVTALREAEELLDCLEVQGYQERELVLVGEACFAVKWR